MKPLPLFVTALLTFSLIGLRPAHSETAVEAASSHETRVDLSASVMKKVLQDRLQAALQLRVEGDTAEEVQETLNRRMKVVWEKASTAQSVDAELVAYRVWFEKPGRYSDSRVTKDAKWVGVQTISLESGEFDALRSLVGELQSDGLAVNQLRFFVSDSLREETEDALIPQVARELGERAKQVAEGFGVGAVRLDNIVLGTGGSRPPMYRAEAMEADASGGGASAPVAEPVYEDVHLNMSATAYIQTVILD